MSLKSAIRIVLAIAILFAAVGGMAHLRPSLPTLPAYGQLSHTQFGFSAPQPVLACDGCSGGSGGPG